MRDTIDMAREAGAMLYDSPKNPFKLIDIMFTPETLAAFEALVRADERADCERVVGIALLGAEMDLAKRVLRAIRARGNT
jgi:hypothetical protein